MAKEVACKRPWNPLGIAVAACAASFCTSARGPGSAPGTGGVKATGGETDAAIASGGRDGVGGASRSPDAEAQGGRGGGTGGAGGAMAGGAGAPGTTNGGAFGAGGVGTGGATSPGATVDAGSRDVLSGDVPIAQDTGAAIDVAACLDLCALGGAICCGPELGCAQPGGSCVFDMLAGSVGSPGLAYAYDTLEQRIAALSQEITVSVTDADIDRAATDPWPSARIEIHLTAKASAEKGAILAKSGPFRVSCNGTPLFVGQFYMLEGAAALHTPVIHFAYDTDNTVILRLGALQGAWYANFASQEDKQRIDRPELRRLLCQRAALRALAP